jgi:hypothetical protein
MKTIKENIDQLQKELKAIKVFLHKTNICDAELEKLFYQIDLELSTEDYDFVLDTTKELPTKVKDLISNFKEKLFTFEKAFKLLIADYLDFNFIMKIYAENRRLLNYYIKLYQLLKKFCLAEYSELTNTRIEFLQNLLDNGTITKIRKNEADIKYLIDDGIIKIDSDKNIKYSEIELRMIINQNNLIKTNPELKLMRNYLRFKAGESIDVIRLTESNQ